MAGVLGEDAFAGAAAKCGAIVGCSVAEDGADLSGVAGYEDLFAGGEEFVEAGPGV